MSKKKNKNIRFEKMLAGYVVWYDPKRNIKDIENNRKHKPKGQR